MATKLRRYTCVWEMAGGADKVHTRSETLGTGGGKSYDRHGRMQAREYYSWGKFYRFGVLLADIIEF